MQAFQTEIQNGVFWMLTALGLVLIGFWFAIFVWIFNWLKTNLLIFCLRNKEKQLPGPTRNKIFWTRQAYRYLWF